MTNDKTSEIEFPKIIKVNFPNITSEQLWSRKKDKGFFTTPRTMPIIMELIDELTKGFPASKVYLALWSRTEEKTHRGAEMVVPIKNLQSLALECGFYSNRNRTTLENRLKLLEELGFIKSATSDAQFFGKYEFILIVHPHHAINELFSSGRLNQSSELMALYKMYIIRLREIGGIRPAPKPKKEKASQPEKDRPSPTDADPLINDF